MKRILEGILVRSNGIERQQVEFDSETGLIIAVGQLGHPRPKVDFYFDDSSLVFSGMGDVHIHGREDPSGRETYKEDYLSMSQAAINGGIIHVSDMPNNPSPPIDQESYLNKLALINKSSITILLYAGIGPTTQPLPFLVPYKVYMAPSIGDLYFKNKEKLQEVLALYKDCWVSFHCEDPETLEKHKDAANFEQKRPIEAELMATSLALELIEKFSLKGKVCHFSAGRGLAMLKDAKRKGVNVVAEVSPQHLFFCTEELGNLPPIFYQMNPPIRGKADQQLMLESFLKGEIDFLATDHAPHTIEEKERGISGMTGLDTYGAFVSWLLVEKKMDPRILAKVASENPGNFVNQFLPSLSRFNNQYKSFGKGFGQFLPEYSASFTIINLKQKTTITRDFLKTKAGWSPFEGITFPGSVEAVFSQGLRKK